MILINQKTKIILYLGFLFLFLLIFSKSTAGDLLNESAINSEDYCENALGWYYENPEYRGEFVRVLEYCKKNAKDVSPEAIERISIELEMYRTRNLYPILQVLIYIIDTMRKHDIVWGVGRGSSVASYVLYILGIHKVDSLKYNLDIKEFLKDE